MRTLSWIVSFLVAGEMCRAQTQTSCTISSGRVELIGHAAKLYQEAQSGRWFAKAAELNPDVLPTSDGQSFIVVWKATREPKHWIVSLHGSGGFATDDLAIWYPHLKDLDAGVMCIQWRLGSDEMMTSYYTPEQIYREVDKTLQRLKVRPGTAMLHGFSRGAANSYAVMALDASRGRRFFSLAVASSGGVGLDYPPTRAIVDGTYGRLPLKDTRWITVAGAHDPNPNRDGIPGMRRAATWLREQGAIVLETIEDPDHGHGALVRNAKNIQRVMTLFLKDQTETNAEPTHARDGIPAARDE